MLFPLSLPFEACENLSKRNLRTCLGGASINSNVNNRQGFKHYPRQMRLSEGRGRSVFMRGNPIGGKTFPCCLPAG